MSLHAETLHWVADELEAQIEELRQDWVKVLLSAGARSRINAFSEVAAMCRKAATRKGKKMPARDVASIRRDSP
jgi:hypothetical protein